MKRVCVLGLDGATWSVLDPLIEEGYLPHLKALINIGQRASLRSTIPPVTAPAWASLATGLNPGRTGVWDFFSPRGDARFVPANSDVFRGRAMWDYAAGQGHRCLVYNYPLLYPPYPVPNSVLVSGLLAPDDGRIAYPSSIRGELDRIGDPYFIHVRVGNPRYLSHPREAFDDLMNALRMRVEAFKFMLDKARWDLVIAVFSETDWAQHFFWRDWDSSHPLHCPKTSPLRREWFKEFWQEVDRLIGILAERFAEDYLMIVSDHGFGPQYGVFHLNQWLARQGWLVWKRPPLKRYIHAFGKQLTDFLERGGFSKVAGRVRSFRRAVKPEFAEEIARARSQVFAGPYSAVTAGLHMVSPKTSEERFWQDLLGKLAVAANECAGEPLAFEIFRKEQEYEGKYMPFFPDRIILMDRGKVALSYRRTSSSIYEARLFLPNHSGSHRLYGVILVAGEEGRLREDGRVVDVAPAVCEWLHLEELPYFDGEGLIC